MFSFFKSDPKKKILKEYTSLLEKAMNAQRNGDLETCARLTEKADELRKKVEAMDEVA